LPVVAQEVDNERIGLRECVPDARVDINADENERRRSNETEQNALTVMPAVFRLRLYAVTTVTPLAKMSERSAKFIFADHQNSPKSFCVKV